MTAGQRLVDDGYADGFGWYRATGFGINRLPSGASRRGNNRYRHIFGFEAHIDQHFGHTHEHTDTQCHLDDLGVAEIGLQSLPGFFTQ